MKTKKYIMWSCTSPTATQFSSKDRLFLSSTHPLIQYSVALERAG